MFIYDYVMVTMATISFSLLFDVLTIVLRFVVSRANRKEVMCKNKISQLLEVYTCIVALYLAGAPVYYSHLTVASISH